MEPGSFGILREAVVEIGIPVVICIVFLYLVLDNYFFDKNVRKTQLEAQVAVLKELQNCSRKELEIQELILNRVQQFHDFTVEVRARCPYFKGGS